MEPNSFDRDYNLVHISKWPPAAWSLNLNLYSVPEVKERKHMHTTRIKKKTRRVCLESINVLHLISRRICISLTFSDRMGLQKSCIQEYRNRSALFCCNSGQRSCVWCKYRACKCDSADPALSGVEYRLTRTAFLLLYLGFYNPNKSTFHF